MKTLVRTFAATLLTMAVGVPAYGQQQLQTGIEGPDVRKMEPKGTEGPDVRKKKTKASAAPKSKVEPKGIEPGNRKEPKGVEGPEVRQAEPKGIERSDVRQQKTQ